MDKLNNDELEVEQCVILTNKDCSDSDSDKLSRNTELFNAIHRKPKQGQTITEEERLEEIKECLINKANINAVDKNNKDNTLLHVAVKKSYKKIVKFILNQKEINIDIVNKDGKTAKELALNLSNENIKYQFSEHDKQDISLKRTFNGECNTIKKIKFSNLEENSHKRKFSTDAGGTPNKKVLLDNLTMPSDGLKLAEHGNIFQLKLLMLCLWRAAHAVENGEPKYKEFRLATEMPGAEKFDDIAFQYKEDNSNRWKFRLLQAKHKEGVTPSDPLPKIKLGCLLSTDDDEPFSLQKYFHSYLKVRERSFEHSIYSVFSDSAIEDVIIITNADFHSNKEKEIFMKDSQEIVADVLLKTDKQDTQVYKLRDEECKMLINRLKMIFENSSDFYKLIELLADHILSNKQIDKASIFKEYYYPLVKEILQIDIEGTGREKKHFINLDCLFKRKNVNGEALGKEASNIRDALIKEIAFRKSTVKISEINKSFGSSELPDNEEELNALGTKVVEFIQENKKFNVIDFNEYHVALAQNVLNVEHGKLNMKFIKESVKPRDNKILTTLARFKKCFIGALERLERNRKITNEYLKTVIIHNISDDFGSSKLPTDEKVLKILAVKLADSIKQNICLSVEDFPNAHIGLAEEVIDTNTKSFYKAFKNGQVKRDNKYKPLTPEAKKLRRLLINEIENQDIPITISGQELTLKNIDEVPLCSWLSSSKIKVSEGFASGFKPEEKIKIQNVDLFANQMANLLNDEHNKEQKVIKINKATLNLSDNDFKIFYDNIRELAGHALINRYNKVRFSTIFINQSIKPGILPNGIEEFKTKLKELLNNDRFELLYEYEFKFDKEFITSEDGELYRKLPTIHTDEDIKIFFSKLKFIVNYPNREAINNLLGPEIKDQIKTLDSAVFRCSYYENLHSWMADRIGTFYTPSKAKFLFKQIHDNLSLWTVDGFNKPYFADCCQEYKFEKYNILDEFLASNKQILQLTCRDPFLGRTRIVQRFQELQAVDDVEMQNYTRNFGHIFLYLKQLEDQDFRSMVYKVIKTEKFFDFVVIECNVQLQDTIGFYNNVCEIISSSTYKKLIFIISEGNDALANKFAIDLKKIVDDDTSYKDLTARSKSYLLEKNVKFPSKKESVSLKQLYFKVRDGEEPSSERLSQVNIDSKTLTQLIKNDEIVIGKGLVRKSDLEGPYHRIYEKIETDVWIKLIEAQAGTTAGKSNTFFVISGIDEENKVDTLIAKVEACNKNKPLSLITNHICEFETHIQYDKRIILADSKFSEKDFKHLCHTHPDDSVSWIKCKGNTFIIDQLYYPKFLGRKFVYPKDNTIPHDVKTELFKSINNIVFFFTGINGLKELAEALQLQNIEEKETFYKLGNIKLSKNNNKNGPTKINKFDFDRLVKAQDNKSVYWLHVNKNNEIAWHDISRYTILEDTLMEKIIDKSSIIIDKPGMGKSTSLIILSEQMLKLRTTPLYWTILITLRDWQEVIRNIPDEINNEAVVQFLADTKNISSPLEDNLAKYILDSRECGVKFLFLFDGFDEIRSYSVENIGKKKLERLLRFLKGKTQCTIWITAREHDATALKNTLLAFDIRFRPLEKCQQEEYFRDVWKNFLQFSISQDTLDRVFEHKFRQYYKELSLAVGKILTEGGDDFMGIPLTLYLFETVFRSEFNKFLGSNDNNDESFKKTLENLDILILYKRFIDEKFRIFFDEKTNLSDGFTTITEDWLKTTVKKFHCRLAFKELFGAGETIKLLGIKKPFVDKDINVNSEQLKEILSLGIIRSTIEGHYEFLHRTLAEYFVSELFVYMLECKERDHPQKYKQVNTFLKENILKDSNKVIYKFLDARSKKDNAFNDKWKLIISSDVELYNLLGPSHGTNKFTIDDTTIQDENVHENIEDLIKSVEKYVGWNKAHTSFTYYGDSGWTESIKKLIRKALIETDSDKLKSTLEFLTPLFDKSEFAQFNAVLTQTAFIDILSRYLWRAKKQLKLNLQFVKYCLTETNILKNYEQYSQLVAEDLKLDIQDGVSRVDEFFGAQDSGWLKNSGVDFVRASMVLTPKIADAFNSKLQQRRSFYELDVYNYLILPLLNFKYFSKYDSTLFSEIDNVALLNMFSVFAGEGSERVTLCQMALEGLLECIRYAIHPEHISSDGFRYSVKSLMALNKWNFRLVYKDRALSLHHNTEDYSCLLKLHYEERIVKLLKQILDSPQLNFDQEYSDIAMSVS